MSESTSLAWFRRDLRLHDNEALAAACDADGVLPVYCLDPREYGDRPFGGSDSFDFDKTGAHRARFRLESLSDLRASLRDRGSDLVVREGTPESVLPELAATVDADFVTVHTRPTPEESSVESAVERGLRDDGVDLRRFWGHTLTHLDDLPMALSELPDTYTTFRKAVESAAEGDEGGDAGQSGESAGDGDPAGRDPLSEPDVPPLPVDAPAAGDLPSLSDLVGTGAAESPRTPDDRGVLPFDGGETAAFDRVESYIWTGDHLREYKETRNGLLGADYSSKLSPWLNEGCLSPRYVKAEVDRYEDRRVANDSTYWLVFELRWRDFFQFQFAKHGSDFFRRGGIRERTDIDWRADETQFERWAAGETGIPFVDANMRELNATGYMSNRGRQNAASFLANDLRLDWRRGAAYFETQLVDYDPASNYGNWAYIAGVGNDSRDRSFDVRWQAKRYDEDAEYVRTWLPELDVLPAEYAHEPWELSDEEQATYGVELGVDYPEPMVDLDGS
ncbi:cryptochrome DASH [Haloferax sp. Atlit-10N]|uniref:DASH family cryptochrome n=1 Tax=unclassified Haloferax TaxID=2625095 RepID=UPI000E26AF60|nr:MULTISPECIES: DASH family cryptochrome [unclassified Haloferax]RDZ44084.1 cryptochrome DASH [Haloferax sp. Atlit-16N]RDZ47572.1 cryptochrome DASH [Haloferax sp. Atlit-19N]RDZ58128.1 cryptochrome DASH [Haloferax sp. Atlit-10N]